MSKTVKRRTLPFLIILIPLLTGYAVTAPINHTAPEDRVGRETSTASATRLPKTTHFDVRNAKPRTLAPIEIGTELAPEAPDDPPAPPSVLGRRTAGGVTVVSFGPFISRQVNVDGAGNNTNGDAANEPSMAIDPTNPNRIVIAWRQFDTIASNFRQAGVAYSHDLGLTWTATTLDPGQFRSDPVLGTDNNGTFFFSSLSTLTTIEMFRSFDGGVTWSFPPAPAFGGDKQWIAIDRTSGIGQGNIYQFWNIQFTCCPPNDLTRSVDGATSFESPVVGPLPRIKWGTMDVGPDGTLYFGGAALDTRLGHIFAKSTNAQDNAVTPTIDFVTGVDLGGSSVTGGINPAGLLGQVWIATDHSDGPSRGYIYIAGTVFDFGGNNNDGNITNVKFIRSMDDGHTWSAPVRVNDLPNLGTWNWFGTMSVAPNGRIDMIWNDTRNDPSNLFSQVFYSFSLDQGTTWSTSIAVTAQFDPSLGYPQQNKMGDYFHMISDNGGASLAFSATFNGEEDVWFLRIGRDCNKNGIDDDCDITCGASGTRCDVSACGTKSDCNGNFIPDDCEPNEDCNNDKMRDICEIGAGAADCNGNSILDKCEPFPDCNNNATRDFCELADGSAKDCNGNGILDECDVAKGGSSEDVNNDNIPDECQAACCFCDDCFDTTPPDCTVRGGRLESARVVCELTECAPPKISQCANLVELPSVLAQTVPIDNRFVLSEGPPSVTCDFGDQPFGSDLWFSFVSPCDGNLTASMCGTTNYDAIMAIYGGDPTCECPQDNCSITGCGDDSCGVFGGPPFVTVPVVLGGCYTLRVAGWNGATGTGLLNLTVSPTGECIPDPLEPARNPFEETGGEKLNRTGAFKAPTSTVAGGQEVAIRVKLNRMYIDTDKDPVNGCPVRDAQLPDLLAFENQVRYLGPPSAFDDNAAAAPKFVAAELQCTPVYRDWSPAALTADFGAGVDTGTIYYYGAEVVPCSVHEVQQATQSCVESAGELCFSDPLEIRTALWGDVWPPFGDISFTDIGKVVDAFKSIPFDEGPPPDGAPRKVRAMLRKNSVPFGSTVSFTDIGKAVDGLKTIAYAEDGPTACP